MKKRLYERRYWSQPIHTWKDHEIWCKLWFLYFDKYNLHYLLFLNILIIRQKIETLFIFLLSKIICIKTKYAKINPEKILLIIPNHLGDFVLLTPAIESIRKKYSNSNIKLVCGPWIANDIKNMKNIDEVLIIPFPHFDRSNKHNNKIKNALLLINNALFLRKFDFDMSILMIDDYLWGAILATLVGIPRRIGFRSPRCQPFLTDSVPWQPSKHITEQALELVHEDRFCVEQQSLIKNHPLCFYPLATDEDWADRLLNQFVINKNRPVILIHPGTGGPAKMWLTQRWVDVTNELSMKYDADIIISGSSNEKELLSSIAKEMKVKPLVIMDSMTVSQLAALIKRVNLVIGVDSGPLHLAVSQNTPSIRLFGSTDPFRFGPWGDKTKHIVIQNRIWCSPCNMTIICPRKAKIPHCIENIQVRQVLQVAHKLLDVMSYNS